MKVRKILPVRMAEVVMVYRIVTDCYTCPIVWMLIIIWSSRSIKREESLTDNTP